MSNEELASRIKTGETDLIADLWGQTKALFYLFARRYYNSKREICDRAGVALEDLEQCSYFAMLQAVNDYKPESGYLFNSFIDFHALNEYNQLTGQRTVKQRKDPLNHADSFENPVPGTDNLSIADMIEDDSAAISFEDVEQVIYNKQVHEMLERALNKLPEAQQKVIRLYYYNGFTFKQISEKENKSMSRCQQLSRNAMRAMRRNAELIRFYRDQCSYALDRAYCGSSSAFKTTLASSVELTAEKREKLRTDAMINLLQNAGEKEKEILFKRLIEQ